jgi:hypothetical protein
LAFQAFSRVMLLKLDSEGLWESRFIVKGVSLSLSL